MTYRIVTLFFILLTSILWGCGGNISLPPQTASTHNVNLRASDVFKNVAETWEYVGHCGNKKPDGTRGPIVEAHAKIEIIPVSENQTTWHYTKDQPCMYWLPDVDGAEIYFFLEKDSIGTWYSTGGHDILPHGCPWCGPNNTPTTDYIEFTYSVDTIPGHPRPYMILGDSGVSVETVFPDFGFAEGRWATKMYMQTIQQTDFLVSEQWETNCGHEIWWFKNGLEKVAQDMCDGTKDVFIMERVH